MTEVICPTLEEDLIADEDCATNTYTKNICDTGEGELTETSDAPTESPTDSPTESPTMNQSTEPSDAPSESPSMEPSDEPTDSPN